MLRAESLWFSRNAAGVLAGVSLAVGAGEVVKVTGGNGGGKTTLLKLLCLLLPAERGAVHWRGADAAADADAYRECLLYIGHHNALAEDLSALENLRTAAALRLRPPKIPLEAALQAAGLGAALMHRPCRRLSAGQRRRAALARLLAFDAELWLLDEPLAALDGDGRAMLTQWLRAHLAAGGMAVCTMHHAADWDIPAATVLECSGGNNGNET